MICFFTNTYSKSDCQVIKILFKNKKQQKHFVQCDNYSRFKAEIKYLSNKSWSIKLFIVNIYIEDEIIDSFSKKEIWKVYHVDIYKQKFEHYYDIHYSHYELTSNNSMKTNVKKKQYYSIDNSSARESQIQHYCYLYRFRVAELF